jgi:hypothetical protein
VACAALARGGAWAGQAFSARQPPQTGARLSRNIADPPQGDACPRFSLPCLLSATAADGRFPARFTKLSPECPESEVIRPSIRVQGSP